MSQDPDSVSKAAPGPETAAPEPQLAVIIPHYNDPVRLGRCLAALAPQLAAHPQVEAVVADNASPCDLAPLQAAHPEVRFVTEPTKGAAAARNRGVAETRAPLIAFLDSDCVPSDDWLATALRLAGTAGLTGGRVDTFDETPAPRSAPRPSRRSSPSTSAAISRTRDFPSPPTC